VPALTRGLFGAFVIGLGVSITLAETALALLALLLLARLWDPAVRAQARWPLWQPVVAFSAVTVVSAVSSGHPGTALLASKSLLLVAALYVTATVVRDAEDADRFVAGLTLVLTVAAGVGLLQVELCPGPGAPEREPRWLYHRCDRAHGFFSIYMTLAGVLLLGLLAGLPRLLSGPASRWGWRPVAWLVMLAGLVATYTRSAWIGFGVGVLVVVAAVRRGRWLLVGGLVLLIVGGLAAPYQLRQRVLSIADPQHEGMRERVYMWRSGLAMWRDHPLLGVGPGGVKREYPRYALPEASKQRTSHVHNAPLQILVERGILGLAAWVWLWVAFFVFAIRRLRRLPPAAAAERALVVGSLAAIAGFLVAGLAEHNFGDSEVVMVAWSVMALPWAVEERAAPSP
jgi:putative inorganic carbon (hco3(-)) transporter